MEASKPGRRPRENKPRAPEDLVQPEQPDKTPAPATAEPAETPHTTNRRTFLRAVGKRAIYVAPVIAALTATQAQAASAPPSGTCLPSDQPCTVDEDCCSGHCVGAGMMCEML